MPVYRRVNKDFFKTWSREMAYVLGFFAADGTMIENKRGAHFVEFHITDRKLLENIRREIKSNHKISIRIKNSKWKPLYRLQIGSKEMFSDLTKLGFSQSKSKSLNFPSIPSKYMHHFIRGYFDGDGNVYFRKHWAKDRKKERWVFASRFTSGSELFLKELHLILRRYGIRKGFISKKKGGYELVLSHRDSLALFKLMYNNVPGYLHLGRKFRLFQKAIKTLYGGVAQLV